MELSGLDPASQAACLLAVDPHGLGGLCVRGSAGPARDALLARLRAMLPPGTPWHRLPPQIDDERLLGGLDLGLSLAAGRPVTQAGLLAQARGGVLVLPMAERADAGLAGRLAAALEPGASGGRGSCGAAYGPGLCVVALDEGQTPQETVPPSLLERLALIASPAGIDVAALLKPVQRMTRLAAADAKAGAMDRAGDIARGSEGDGAGDIADDFATELTEVRRRCEAMACDDAVLEALCATASALGIESLRTPWQAWRAARAAAALAGRTTVTQADAELAARLVLAPRARALPQAADAQAGESPDEPSGEPRQDDARIDEPPPQPPPATGPDAQPDAQAQAQPGEEVQQVPEDADASPPALHDASVDASADALPPRDADPAAQGLQERLIEATAASIPEGLLASLAGAASDPASGRGAGRGRAGGATRPARSGRPLSPRRGTPRGGSRLDLLATLRAAIPWQRMRQAERARQGGSATAPRVLLRREDFHIRRFHRPGETTTVFVVDASGSQALHRLAEAKGAVELLLADCYVRRDRVALIAFRGSGAETLLAPTRSLVRARRSLSGLPGGGGTPLAAGIEAAWLMGSGLQSGEGSRAVLVFLTDARANIARDGSPGRPQAMDDALAAARRLREAGLASVLIDTSPRPQPAALALAQAMAARYVPLPQGQAAQVYAAVSGAAAPPA